MKIISANDRLAEHRGVIAFVVGPAGVGKTTLLRTLNSADTLFLDAEAGDLAVQDVPVDTLRVDDWPTARDWRAEAPIRPIRQRPVTREHTSTLSAALSKTLQSTTRSSSTASRR